MVVYFTDNLTKIKKYTQAKNYYSTVVFFIHYSNEVRIFYEHTNYEGFIASYVRYFIRTSVELVVTPEISF
ncbi:MAG: hypothetical protein V1904_02530 [Bacteroidota bacterium]